MIDPHKRKYHEMYWNMAYAAANQSVATRHKVGAIVVTSTGMISPGFNGMPSGFDNNCEVRKVWDETTGQFRPKTNPEVIHAERNAIDKMTRQGVATQGSILFVTLSPCFECSKSLLGLGLKAIYFDALHDDVRGLDLLDQAGIPIYSRNNNDVMITPYYVQSS